MGVECYKLFAHLCDHSDLLLEQLVKAGYVLLDVGSGLVYFVKEGHLLFYQVHNIIDMSAVPRNNFLFLLKNLFDKFLVFSA